MKKNISINLFGTLYSIDEDAYNLLESYLDSMKSYFSRQEGGEEIADDIEHRVAELLWEEKEKGAEAVNKDMVKSIIEKIGNPEQISGADETESSSSSENANESTDSASSTSSASSSSTSAGSSTSSSNPYQNNNLFSEFTSGFKGRKLYRDMTDKIVAGVCSGLSRFFGGDPTIWRLGTVVMTIVLGSIDWWFVPDIVAWFIPITYIILWAVVPIAVTAEDKLRMRGEEVNPQNLNQQILHDSDPKVQQMVYAQNSSSDGCLKIAGAGCLAIILIPFCVFVIMLLIAAPMFSGLLSSGMFHNIPFFRMGEGEVTGGMFEALQGMIWAIAGCGLILLLIPIFFLIRWLKGSKKPLGTGAVIALVGVWLAALIFGLFMFFRSAGQLGTDAMQWHIEQRITTGDDYDWENDEDGWMNEDTVAVDSIETDSVIMADVPTDSVVNTYSVLTPAGSSHIKIVRKTASGHVKVVK